MWKKVVVFQRCDYRLFSHKFPFHLIFCLFWSLTNRKFSHLCVGQAVGVRGRKEVNSWSPRPPHWGAPPLPSSPGPLLPPWGQLDTLVLPRSILCPLVKLHWMGGSVVLWWLVTLEATRSSVCDLWAIWENSKATQVSNRHYPWELSVFYTWQDF